LYSGKGQLLATACEAGCPCLNVTANQPVSLGKACPFPRGLRGSPVMGLSAHALTGVGRARVCVIIQIC
jgi:hypothetical protein